MKKIAEIFNQIEKELQNAGYITEQLKMSSNSCTKYLVFFKSIEDKIWGIESSKTFDLSDVISDCPELYFYIGGLEKVDNDYEMRYVTFVEYTESITNVILKTIYENSENYNVLQTAHQTYEKWKVQNNLFAV